MEAEGKHWEDAEKASALRDKLLLMEDKLAKMKRRKSVSITQEMQTKMVMERKDQKFKILKSFSKDRLWQLKNNF